METDEEKQETGDVKAETAEVAAGMPEGDAQDYSFDTEPEDEFDEYTHPSIRITLTGKTS